MTSGEFERLFVEALSSHEIRNFVKPQPRDYLIERLESGRPLEDVAVRQLYAALDRHPKPPKWVALLKQMVAHFTSNKTPYNHRLSIAQNFASPAVEYLAGQLFGRKSADYERVLSEKAKRSLIVSLRSRLGFSGKPAVDWIWRAAVMNRGVLGANSAISSHDFLRIYFADGVQRRTLSLLCTFPGLARLWAMQGLLWLSFIRRFLRHTRQSLPVLSADSPVSPNRVAAVQPDRSDLHHGNRSVMRVTLSNGGNWYYKPRSGTPELMWARLLQAISQPSIGITFRASPKLVCGRSYCWMEAVPQKACRTKREASEFFLKCGVMLYLLHCLRGVDFHAANLIAQGSEPVLIDCETLLHPACDPVQSTILAIGFLPLLASNGDGQSALGRLLPGKHMARLGSRPVFASDFPRQILAGFHMLGSATRNYVNNTIQRVIRAVSLRQTRYLTRSTRCYYGALESSLTVEALVTGARRWRYLHRLCGGPNSSRRTMSEALALEQADIPIFYHRAANLRSITARRLERESETLRLALDQLRLTTASWRSRNRFPR